MTEREELMMVLDALDGSRSMQVDAALRMIRRENVDALLAAMPPDFREAFVEWIRTKYAGGPTISIGRSGADVPEAGILAMRDWLSRHRASVLPRER